MRRLTSRMIRREAVGIDAVVSHQLVGDCR
jgi:hypothetical protein